MKKLHAILTDVEVIQLTGSDEVDIAMLQYDSRGVEPGSLFAAIKGTATDGHRFISQAIALGATAILCEILPEQRYDHITYIRVKNSAIALGIIASNFFDRPSDSLKVIGITGTNGKTTTATLLYQLFENMGIKAGLISTVTYCIHHEVKEASHTTPDPIQLHRLLRHMVDAGCQYCFMEVSSHGLDQQRVSGLTFSGGVLTNITHDHLDYHHSFDNYIKVKKSFFDRLSPDAFALVNKDDRHGKVMFQNCSATKVTYGLASMADYRGKVLENTVQGLHMVIDGDEVWFHLIGRFNGYNLLAAYSTALLLGLEKTDVLSGLSQLRPVAGRFNYLVSPEKVTAIVDYAHTPDALQNVMETIDDIRQGGGRLITVVGAGGNRDAAKRPVMAAIACRFSNRVILTSDNPRFEDPASILSDMNKGVPVEFRKNLLEVADRKEAIKTACALAQPGDYILVAGKGHETYQEIKGVKYPFDDRNVLSECFGNKQIVN